MSRDTLHQSFLDTTYIVYAPDAPIRLRIGSPEPALDLLLDCYGATTWAFITAWNPDAIESPFPEENKERNEALRMMLATMGFEFLPGEGVGDSGTWKPEASFWVPGIAREAALELGRHFRQAAIVAGARGGAPELHWCSDDLS